MGWEPETVNPEDPGQIAWWEVAEAALAGDMEPLTARVAAFRAARETKKRRDGLVERALARTSELLVEIAAACEATGYKGDRGGAKPGQGCQAAWCSKAGAWRIDVDGKQRELCTIHVRIVAAKEAIDRAQKEIGVRLGWGILYRQEKVFQKEFVELLRGRRA